MLSQITYLSTGYDWLWTVDNNDYHVVTYFGLRPAAVLEGFRRGDYCAEVFEAIKLKNY